MDYRALDKIEDGLMRCVLCSKQVENAPFMLTPRGQFTGRVLCLECCAGGAPIAFDFIIPPFITLYAREYLRMTACKNGVSPGEIK